MSLTNSATFSLNLGSPVQFACVRGFFRSVGFDDVTLCRVLGMDDMSDLGRVQWDRLDPAASTPATADQPLGSRTPQVPPAGGDTRDAGANLTAPLALVPLTEPEKSQPQSTQTLQCPAALVICLRVFVRGLIVPEDQVRQICGEEVIAAFLGLGLLRRAVTRANAVFCPVWLYPADGFVLASDRRDDPENESFVPPGDVVFPAIYAGTLRFLRLLPAVQGNALDLCGGSGIGALHLSRTASCACSADITPRSALFAEFNARLNDIRVRSLCGDLYAPVVGKQFDLICAHPPFVPDTGPKMVYRDGGETGEDITRRIIEGLPASLRAGGMCVILCVARDTQDQLFEQRAAGWLRERASEFDLVFGLEKVLAMDAVVDSIRGRNQHLTATDARELLARLRDLGTRQFVYGALFVRRSAEPVNQSPLRVQMTATASARDFERVLSWRSRCRSPRFDEWLAGSRPRLAPELELTARHVVRNGALVPAEFVFSIDRGLAAALRPDAWVVPLVARLEGQSSVAEIFEQARASGELPDGFRLTDFLGLVQSVIERGFLELELPLQE